VPELPDEGVNHIEPKRLPLFVDAISMLDQVGHDNDISGNRGLLLPHRFNHALRAAKDGFSHVAIASIAIV
jgi:hypothetical protein